MGVDSASPNVDPSDDALMRAITFPEEDRRLFTAAGWQGEYRWFRSPNVVPLEHWRAKRESNQRPPPLRNGSFPGA
jgi:hypothetical protein